MGLRKLCRLFVGGKTSLGAPVVSLIQKREMEVANKESQIQIEFQALESIRQENKELREKVKTFEQTNRDLLDRCNEYLAWWSDARQWLKDFEPHAASVLDYAHQMQHQRQAEVNLNAQFIPKLETANQKLGVIISQMIPVKPEFPEGLETPTESPLPYPLGIDPESVPA